MLSYFPILLAGYLSFLTVDPLSNEQLDNAFRSPLDIELRLTGTFGELRSNHFHSGIDIATEGRTGLSIYACEDGYVSRLRIGPRGFGKAIYVTHPNGLTTVYAHLNRFDEAIAKWASDKQYELEQWGFDLEVPIGELLVSKGEVIAKSGNSGSSGGPHLHFEIRDGDTPLNPLNYGFKVTDTQSPSMLGLYLYDIWKGFPVGDGQQYPLSKQLTKTIELPTGGNASQVVYSPAKTVLLSKGDYAGLGIKVYDRQDGRHSKNGVYRLQLKVDGAVVYHFKLDSFHFHESRYINSHIDFSESLVSKVKLHRCFRLPGNELSIYDQLVDDGMIQLYTGSKRAIEIIAWDIKGNQSVVRFDLNRAKEAFPPEVSYNQLMQWDGENFYTSDQCRLSIPDSVLYDDLFFAYKMEERPNGWSAMHTLDNSKTPLHAPATLSIRSQNLPEALADKAVIVHKNSRGALSSLGGKLDGDFISCKTTKLGSFYIEIDTIGPKLTSLNLSENKFMGNEQYIRYRVSDNLSGFAEYRAEIDGKWVPMAYDPRKNLLAFNFDSHSLEPGGHSFVLTVEDERKNVTSSAISFRR